MDRRLRPGLVARYRAVGIGAVVFAASALYTYFAVAFDRVSAAAAEELVVSEVAYGTFREYIPLTGTIVPRRTVYLDAVDGGQVASVLIEEGAMVAAGQPLVELKNTHLHLQVIAAEAQLAEQLNFLSQTSLLAEQARLRNQMELIEINRQIDRLGRELDRRGQLVAPGGVAQGEIDDLAADLAYRKKARGTLLEGQRVDEKFRVDQLGQMRITLDAMNKNLAIARANLDNLVIAAPIAGQLTLLDAEVGESKGAGERIGQIDDPSSFRVSAFIDEFYLQRVAVGQAATFEDGKRTHRLEVHKVYPDVRNRLFQVDLLFAGAPPELIRRGQTVPLQLEIGLPAEVLVLPNGGFYEDTGGQWAFVLSESSDRAERRPVRFGRRNTESVEVLQGLRRGQQVITSSYERFADVDRIDLRATP